MAMPWRAPIYLAPTDAVRACIREAPVARDRDAYHACAAERGDPYFYCLNQNGGQGPRALRHLHAPVRLHPAMRPAPS